MTNPEFASVLRIIFI